MDRDRLSLIKNTLLGALGGSAITSLYLMQKAKDDAKSEQDLARGVGKNQIIVPLSRKHFMKALGLGKKEDGKKDSKQKPSGQPDVSSMSPSDLAAYKSSLLKKRAECQKKPAQQKKKTDAAGRLPMLRGENGRYASSSSASPEFDKKAGIMSDAEGTMYDWVGAFGGAIAGASVVKKIADTIAVNRKKKQVERARRQYAGMIRGEINDEDEPYYTSQTKSAQDRGVIGRTLGFMGLAGLGSASLAALVTYRILENRRKAAESASDKDLSKYPMDKTISFKFAESNSGNPSFFVNRRRAGA